MNSVRNFLCTILLCLCLSPLIHAQALFSRDAENLQTAAAATGNGTALVVRGWGGAIIQVTGTFSATLTIEGTVDGTNWVTLRVMNVSDGNFVTSVTATGVYAIATAGIETIRARVSAYTSGTVTVKGRGSVAVIARSSGGSSSLTVGTTAISGGTVGRVFFHDTGDVMGEYPVTGTAGNAVLSVSPNLTGAPTITSTSNPCFAVGRQGATDPALSVDCSPASSVTGVKVTPAAAGSGVTVGVTSAGANENLVLAVKGTGTLNLLNNVNPIVVSDAGTVGILTVFGGNSNGTRLANGGVHFGSAAGAYWGTGGPVAQVLDVGLSRLAAGVVRLNNASTGAGQLLIGTSTDTADMQLSVYSQSTTRPSLKLNMPSGTSDSQEAFGNYNNGTRNLYITAAGTILYATDNAVDIGASGANRPRNVYVAGQINSSSIVATAITLNSQFSMNAAVGDGIVRFTNNAGTDFSRLQFGGTSSSFPSLKRSSATLQARLADDSGPSAFQSNVVQSSKTSGYTVTSSDTATAFDNIGAGAGVTFTLPTPAAGLNYRFCRVANQTVTLDISGSETVQIGASVTTAGGNVTLDAVGSCVHIWAVNTTQWFGLLSGTATFN